MQSIFHIATRSDWLEAQKRGAYRQSTLNKTLTDEGFIHCSDKHQVLRIANLVYRQEEDLVLLCIDTRKLKAPVTYENTSGGGELFPHVYGPLNTDAVYATPTLNKTANGEFVLPPIPGVV